MACARAGRGGEARQAGRWGWPTVEGLSPHCPEQAAASDVQKRPLHSRFWPRLSRSVRHHGRHVIAWNMTALSKRARSCGK